jgi:hypothetical protein
VKRTVAIALAAATAVLAVLLLVAAFDVRRWEEQMAEGDVRFRSDPSAATLWQVNSILPRDPARWVLGVDDDLRYRDGVQAFWAAHPRVPAFQRPELEAARVQAQVVIRAVAEREEDEKRRSEEANLLGALATSIAPRQEQQRRVESLGAAATYFTEAIRLDRNNEDAMYNLESVLRRLQQEPQSFESPGGRLPRDDASMGGLRDAGSGY